MQIETGKYYKTRNGRKVGPAKKSGVGKHPWNVEWKEGAFYYSEDGRSCLQHSREDDIIAEWPDTPKLWRDMTPEEKGALLLAAHEGKVIERSHNQGTTWKEKANDLWHENHAYRVKPTVETVTLPLARQGNRWSHMSSVEGGTHLVTFETIDGKPDTSSIRMEEL